MSSPTPASAQSSSSTCAGPEYAEQLRSQQASLNAQEALRKANDRAAALESLLEETEAETVQMKAQAVAAENNHREALSQIKILSEASLRHEKELCDARERESITSVALENARTEIEDFKEKIVNLQEVHAKSTDELLARCKELDADAGETTAKLESQLDEDTAALERAQEQAEELRLELARAADDADKSRQQMTAKDASILSLEKELALAVQRQENLHCTLKDQQEELLKEHARATELEAENMNQRETIVSVRADMASVTEELFQSREENRCLLEKCKEIDSYQTMITALEDDLALNRQALERANSTKADLEAIHIELEKAQSALNVARETCRDQESARSVNESTIGMLQEQVACLNVEKTGLRESSEAQENELALRHNKIQILESELSDDRASIKIIEEELKMKDAELSRVHENVNRLEERCGSLEGALADVDGLRSSLAEKSAELEIAQSQLCKFEILKVELQEASEVRLADKNAIMLKDSAIDRLQEELSRAIKERDESRQMRLEQTAVVASTLERVADLESSIGTSRERLATANALNAKKEEDLTREKQKVHSLELELDKSQSEICQLKIQVEGAEIARQTENIMANDLHELQAELQGLSETYKAAQEALRAKESQIRRMEEEVSQLTEDRNQIQHLVRAKEQEIDTERTQRRELETELTRKEEMLVALKSELSDKSESLSRVMASRTEFQNLINDFENTITNLQGELKDRSEVRDELKSFKRLLSDRDSELASAAQKIGNLESETATQRERLASFEVQISTSTAIISQTKEEIRRLTDECATLKAGREELEDLNKVIASREAALETIDSLETTVACLRDELRSVTDRCEQVSISLSDSNGNKAQLSAELFESCESLRKLDASRKNLEEELTREQAKSERLENEIRLHLEMTQKLETALEAGREELKALSTVTASRDAALESVRSLETTAAELREELRSTTERCERVSISLTDGNENVARLSQELFDSRESLRNLDASRGILEEKLANEQAKSKRLEVEVSLQQERAQILETALEAGREELKNLSTIIASRDAALESISSLEATAAGLREELRSATERCEQVSTSLSDSNENVARLSAELYDSRASFHKMEVSRSRIEDELANEHARSERLADEARLQEERAHTLEAENDKQSKEWSRDRDELDRLRKELVNLEAGKATIVSKLEVALSTKEAELEGALTASTRLGEVEKEFKLAKLQLSSLAEAFGLDTFEHQKIQDLLHDLTCERDRIQQLLGDAEAASSLKSSKIQTLEQSMINDTRLKLEKLAEDLKEKAVALESAESRISAQDTTVSALRSNLKNAAEAATAALRSELSANATLEEKVAALVQDRDDLDKLVKRHEASIEGNHKKIDGLERAVAEQTEEINIANMQVENKTTDLAQALQAIDVLTRKCSTLEVVQLESKRLEAAQSQYTDQIQLLKSTIRDLESDQPALVIAREQAHAAAEETAAKENEISALQTKIGVVTEQRDHAHATLSTREKELDAKVRKFADLEADIASQRQAIANFEAEMAMKIAENTSAQDTISELKDKCTALETSEENVKRLEALLAEKEAKLEDAESAVREMEHLREEVRVAEERFEKANALTKERETELSNLACKLEMIIKERDDALQIIANHENTPGNLRANLMLVEAELENCREREEACRVRLESKVAELSRAQEEIQDLSDKCSTLEAASNLASSSVAGASAVEMERTMSEALDKYESVLEKNSVLRRRIKRLEALFKQKKATADPSTTEEHQTLKRQVPPCSKGLSPSVKRAREASARTPLSPVRTNVVAGTRPPLPPRAFQNSDERSG